MDGWAFTLGRALLHMLDHPGGGYVHTEGSAGRVRDFGEDPCPAVKQLYEAVPCNKLAGHRLVNVSQGFSEDLNRLAGFLS